MKYTSLVIGLACMCMFPSCKDDKDNNLYDPDKPVAVTSFSPSSGGVATKLIISGENFGSDPTLVKVYLYDPARDKQTQAKVVGVSNTCIYALLPRRAGSDNDIKVRVQINESPVVEASADFAYTLAQNVSTVVGTKINSNGTGGEVNGTFEESMLSLPRNLIWDHTTNSVFVTGYEGWGYGIQTIRRVDLTKKEVTTVGTGIQPPDGIAAIDGDIFVTSSFGHEDILFRMNENNAYSNERFINNMNDRYFYWGGDITYNPIDGLLYMVSNYPTLTSIKTIDIRSNDKEASIREFYKVSDSNVKISLAIDNNGVVYYSMEELNVIYKLENKGGVIEQTLVAGKSGERGYKNGYGSDALFNFPKKMVFDEENTMFVSDLNNHCIRKITPDGEVSLLAGVPGVKGKDDGKPLDSKFNEPYGICIDKDGVIYIADRANHRIRKISIE